MKTNLILAAGFLVFTGLCFGAGALFPEYFGIFLKIWYAAALVVWCVFAIKLLRLSMKLSKIQKEKLEIKRRKEKRK